MLANVSKRNPLTVTLKDVATAAKVSVSTASRALAGGGLASSATQARLARVAAELGYRPNAMARGLKTGASGLVGLLVHNLANASFQVLAEVAQSELRARGYQVLLCIVGDDPEQEAETLRALGDRQVDGLIVVPTGRNGGRLAELDRSGVPTVCVVRRDEGHDIETVLADDPQGAYLGTRHLLALGHRRIGLTVGRRDTTSGRERLSGYVRALAEAGVPVDDELVQAGRYEPETGVVAARLLLDRPDPPTAIFVANHESALGVFRVVAERQIRVPDDLSLLVYEDASWFAWHRPAISVVDGGARDLALLAVERLLGRLDSRAPAEPAREYRVGARLVERASCRPVAGHPASDPKGHPAAAVAHPGT